MPSLILISPSGERAPVALSPLPFLIGRAPENHLVIPDQRVSRTHAQIVNAGEDLLIEDLDSRHGLLVNGSKVSRHILTIGDTVEFGVDRSFRVEFRPEQTAAPEDGLSRLRHVLEIARALEKSYSTPQILAAVVDAALRVTGAERGFLFLKRAGRLEMAAARDEAGQPLEETCLTVPRKLISKALEEHREAFALNFDDRGMVDHGETVVLLELRSSIFVPLPRASGVLYLDSRATRAHLASGNRELLETLALEASAVLEHARAIESERLRRKMDEELSVARAIQANLLPKNLLCCDWLRLAGSSRPSRQVGGDYYDARRLNRDAFALTITDVSGKGVSAALLASLIQGSLLMADGSITGLFDRLNQFLLERTGGEKHATIFYAICDPDGRLIYSNAGHCPPVLVRPSGELVELEATSVPIGLIRDADFVTASEKLHPGDKLVAFSDGFSDIVEREPMMRMLRDGAALSASNLHLALTAALGDGGFADDVTVLVAEMVTGTD